jgi:hypothetical protein
MEKYLAVVSTTPPLPRRKKTKRRTRYQKVRSQRERTAWTVHNETTPAKPLSESANSDFAQDYSTKCDDEHTPHPEPACKIFSGQNEEKNQKYRRGLLSRNRYHFFGVEKWLPVGFPFF